MKVKLYSGKLGFLIIRLVGLIDINLETNYDYHIAMEPYLGIMDNYGSSQRLIKYIDPPTVSSNGTIVVNVHSRPCFPIHLSETTCERLIVALCILQ